MFKYHERIFDGQEGLLSKRQQAQQQRMEMNDITTPIPIDSKVPLTLVAENQLPAASEGQISGYTGTDLTPRVGKRAILDM